MDVYVSSWQFWCWLFRRHRSWTFSDLCQISIQPIVIPKLFFDIGCFLTVTSMISWFVEDSYFLCRICRTYTPGTEFHGRDSEYAAVTSFKIEYSEAECYPFSSYFAPRYWCLCSGFQNVFYCFLRHPLVHPEGRRRSFRCSVASRWITSSELMLDPWDWPWRDRGDMQNWIEPYDLSVLCSRLLWAFKCSESRDEFLLGRRDILAGKEYTLIV